MSLYQESAVHHSQSGAFETRIQVNHWSPFTIVLQRAVLAERILLYQKSPVENPQPEFLYPDSHQDFHYCKKESIEGNRYIVPHGNQRDTPEPAF